MLIETAEDIDARLESIYGKVDWRRMPGLLHVAAIESGSGFVLIPGPSAPPSETDRFVLGFARARADALVSTGAILRAEPELVHTYAENRKAQRAFEVWRAERLGLSAPPELILLSASGEFPRDHPALAAAVGGVVWTTESGAARLGDRVGPLGVRVGDGASSALAGVVRWLRSAGRARTIAVEAGPATSDAMYRAAPPAFSADRASSGSPASDDVGAVRCDELLLSRYGAKVSAAALGPPFISEARLQHHFGAALSVAPRLESEGSREEPWRFERYRANAAD